MKKTLSSLLVLMVAVVSAMATGSTPPNTTQTGTFTISASTGLVITNSFVTSYDLVPKVTLFSTSTNSTPWTLTSVSKSNFVVTVTADSTTNNMITWTAVPTVPRIQFGTVSLTGGTPSTNLFPVGFSSTPNFVVSGSTTNGIATTTLSASQFIILSATTQTARWQAIGPTAASGNSTVTY
ncbi:MAG: hypothetical protein KGL39_47490 [Patescibacteria group bacterium]|nr:hypothetical protein [Patescibacteria group bacterium]